MFMSRVKGYPLLAVSRHSHPPWATMGMLKRESSDTMETKSESFIALPVIQINITRHHQRH